MTRKHWIAIGVVVVVIVLVLINLKAKGGKELAVQAEEVTRMDLEMIISASGSIKPKRQIDISASSIGKVTRVAVKEGDYVEQGQFLIQIDPIQLETTVDRLEAAVQSARAGERQAKYQLDQYESDFERAERLFKQGFLTDKEVRDAKTVRDVGISNLESARQLVRQQKAQLSSAKHNLQEVTIEAEMAGIVTRLNVEEGEIAIMGTLNNPGTVLMTIADLSSIEAEVEVDETEVVSIETGQSAEITLDAFPDTSYAGIVTEVGNSPILSSSVSGQQGVDFKVVITVTDTIPNVRPGLSADSEIIAARAVNALAIPIQSLTVRQEKDLKGYAEEADSASADSITVKKEKSSEVEGVFVVVDGKAEFRQIKIGVAGQTHFEILSGLEEGDKVVSGNFRAIRDLKDGQRVKITKKAAKK
ncbi:MAG: efflux RND transporter periplasmic adaptor subunit [Candidatus Krumholzibacteria bacterium]|nr:efflux RND transporter periplasmic adaptor subunit [Candidatus Krumholzibacteria bacterium]